MKYAMVLPDGAADEPLDRFDGRTPLDVAQTPHMDDVAMGGRQGCIVTVPDGYLPGSDVATMSLFGYDPGVYYDGRAPLEAVARGVTAEPNEFIFRCNFVTIIDGMMEDFTAGHISQAEADRLVADLNEHVSSGECTFYSGVSYRNLMIAPESAGESTQCTPPHDIPHLPAIDHLPRGAGATWLLDLMDRARIFLGDHEVNLVRRDMGENPATDIWLWGQGRPRAYEPFAQRFGLLGGLIAAVDLVRGIGLSVGMEVIEVPGATGFLDTDYAAKGRAAVAGLDAYDLIVVHIEAPDEAGHLGDADAKIKAIEQIDEHIVGPLLAKLRTFDKWRILIAPDHPTPVERKVHSATPPPFCMGGHLVHGLHKQRFHEAAAEKAGWLVDPGHELMEYFVRV
ncbi:MAG: cofactor-independent phosphoglycerate mutase [Planctomycetes bacterium]|nr:cofactor-independent phosphoglycerate mutase [Planctomycetota bacterium]